MLYDYLVIGGGIVGVSTAYQLKNRFPEKKVLLLEKETSFGYHQTGHNSGVIHAGVYYAPGSLKAEFCKAGLLATIDFCKKHELAYEQCGKLLVATSRLEVERMHSLYARCKENRIDVELFDAAQLKAREPNITGLGAIYVRDTAIVDYQTVTEKMAELFVEAGGKTAIGNRVVGLVESREKVEVEVERKQSHLATKFLICCTGLMADRTARMLGIDVDFQIIPYRGEYYRLAPHHNDIVRHLIYPIPDPELPFLGVHLTRMIDGSVTVGPNAVQGYKREGYGRINFSMRDVWEMLTFPGFWRVLAANMKTGVNETINSLYKPGYLRLIQKYCPTIRLEDLLPYPAGIRAQAVLRDGTLVHDFLFTETRRSLHVCNAPSPAATSAIPIGNHICDLVSEKTAALSVQ